MVSYLGFLKIIVLTGCDYYDTTDLLDEYISETEELNSLEAEEWKLRQELEDLTQSLMQASDRLNACYKTP